VVQMLSLVAASLHAPNRCLSAVADRRYRKKGTGLVATVPFEKRDSPILNRKA